MADGEEAPRGRSRLFRQVFLLTLLLVLLSGLIQPLITTLTRPLYAPNLFISNPDAFQVANLINQATSFILWPVVPLFVFYIVGSRLEGSSLAYYLHILRNSFAAAVLGGSAVYLFEAGYSALLTDWVSLTAFVLGMVRGGIEFALTTLTGLTLGNLRRTTLPPASHGTVLDTETTDSVT